MTHTHVQCSIGIRPILSLGYPQPQSSRSLYLLGVFGRSGSPKTPKSNEFVMSLAFGSPSGGFEAPRSTPDQGLAISRNGRDFIETNEISRNKRNEIETNHRRAPSVTRRRPSVRCSGVTFMLPHSGLRLTQSSAAYRPARQVLSR